MADDKKLTAPEVARELEVKPSVLRAWLRANGYQKQPGSSYSFTRKEANAIRKAYAAAAAAPAPKPDPAPAPKGRKRAVPTPPVEDLDDDQTRPDDDTPSDDLDDDDVPELDDDEVLTDPDDE